MRTLASDHVILKSQQDTRGTGSEINFQPNSQQTENFDHVITREGPQFQATSSKIADPRVSKEISDPVPRCFVLNFDTKSNSESKAMEIGKS